MNEIRARSQSSSPPRGDFPLRTFDPEQEQSARSRRAPWRQKLVDAERGLTHSFRADSALYLYIFFDSLLLAIGFVLDLSASRWAVVGLGLTVMLAAELFHQALLSAACQFPKNACERVAALSTAAKLIAVTGCTAVILAILWLRWRELVGA
ncbi:MAG: diacylglycerol kinase [Planctomycetaceae bacterium]